jgi:hypothetical protein
MLQELWQNVEKLEQLIGEILKRRIQVPQKVVKEVNKWQ